MRQAKIICALLAVLALIVLSFQNPNPVEFRFLWMQVEIPKIVLMVASAAVGALATLVIQFSLRSPRSSSRNASAGGPSASGPTSL